MDSGNNIKSKLISISLIVFNLILYTAIFICLSFMFTIVHTEAQTIEGNPRYVEGYDQGIIWSCSLTQGRSDNVWCPNDRKVLHNTVKSITYMYELLQTPLLANNTYEIEYTTVFLSNYNSLNTSAIPVSMYVQTQTNGNLIQATCDRNCVSTIERLPAADSTYYVYGVSGYQTTSGYAYRYHFKGEIDMTQQYKYIRWVIGNDNYMALAYIFNNELVLTNKTNPTQDIIDSANQNTQDIINNNNSNTDKIVEEQEKTTQELEDLNDLLSDDTISNHTGVFSNINFNSTGAISGIITAPLSAIQSITSATCSDLVVPLPYVDEDITLPCMTPIYNQHFGAFFTIYQTIILGITAYWVFVSIFKMVQGFSDPMEDRIEVLDL